jgi:uncharacterized membrane protein HdeD (DUF308 family)
MRSISKNALVSFMILEASLFMTSFKGKAAYFVWPEWVKGPGDSGGHRLMLVIGVVEIIAGILVAIKPRIGAYVVCAWLLGIVINLLLIPGFFDIALRDFGLALGGWRSAEPGVQFVGNGC